MTIRHSRPRLAITKPPYLIYSCSKGKDVTTSENGETGFLTEVSDDIATDNKSAALLELASLINSDQYIGDLLSLDYDSAEILIHDSHKNRANGVPHSCLLIASRITPDDPDGQQRSHPSQRT